MVEVLEIGLKRALNGHPDCLDPNTKQRHYS